MLAHETQHDLAMLLEQLENAIHEGDQQRIDTLNYEIALLSETNTLINIT